MAWLSDAHNEWHTVNGKYASCPLDCGINEGVADFFEADFQALEAGAHSIRCGSCKDRHASVAAVKFCYEIKRDIEAHREPVNA